MSNSSLLLIVALILQVPSMRTPAPQTFGDRAAVEAATQAYRTAWLTNDPDKVMATLTADAVISPSTLSPIKGADAIRKPILQRASQSSSWASTRSMSMATRRSRRGWVLSRLSSRRPA